jgi:hypothetical protein
MHSSLDEHLYEINYTTFSRKNGGFESVTIEENISEKIDEINDRRDYIQDFIDH